MKDFFDSTHFIETLPPLEDAFNALNQLKEHFRFHIVTARHRQIQGITKDWLNKYYPNIFEKIHFGNHYGGPGDIARTKADICHSIGAIALIDDSPKYAIQCALAGIKSFIFGDYAWNRDISMVTCHGWDVLEYQNELPSNLVNNILRVKNWSDATHAFQHYCSSLAITQATSFPPPFGTTLIQQGGGGGEEEEEETKKNQEELVVAVVQMCSTNNINDNLEAITQLLEEAIENAQANHGRNVDLVCFPECAIYMGLNSQDTLHTVATTIDEEHLQDPTHILHILSLLAKKYNVYLSIGGFPELVSSSSSSSSSSATSASVTAEKMFNTHLILNNYGEFLNINQTKCTTTTTTTSSSNSVDLPYGGMYRKIHLFDCPLVGLQESKLTGK
jgi:hypothetical protein